MKRKQLISVIAAVACLLLVAGIWFTRDHSAQPQSGAPIEGLWQARDRNSKKPQCIVAIYQYEGKYYGRMLATYDDSGRTIKDTIYEQKEKAPGVVGNPPYCGLDFIYGLEDEGNGKYKGTIIDPEKGKHYDAEVWAEGNQLKVRGEIWVFGQTQTWPAASKKNFPWSFKMPDYQEFKPVVPVVNGE